MSNSWPTVVLGNICVSANTGLDAIKRAPIVEKYTGIKCLRIQDISQSKPISKWGNTEVTDINFEKFRLRTGEIIMARTCSTGLNLLVKEDLPAVFNNGLVRIRADKKSVTPEFLYYLFMSKEFIGHIDGISGGTSVQLNMQIGDLLSYTFPLPPLKEQQAIAEVLSSLDDKIDLLHRNNKTLEEMAETLYRQWFVEGAKEDWEVKTLGTLVSTIVDNRGKTPPTVEFNTGMPLIEVNALNSKSCCVNYSVIRKFVTEETYNSWFRKHLAVKDIIFSTVGSIGIFSLLMKQEGVIAQNVVGLRCSSPFFFYLWLKSNVEVILSLDIGGVQPSIKLPHLLGLEAKVPADSMLNKFENQVEHIFQKIRMNEEQIASLTILRDTLLPKLMSGQVRVNH
jgi:restriction endonuclease S subunit